MTLIRNAFSGYCVYGHFIGSICIYVGMGSIGRAFNNRRNKAWKMRTKGQSVDVVIFSCFANRSDALEMEMRMIESLVPPCNSYGNPNVSKERPAARRPVRHVTTGVEYGTAKEASIATGIGEYTIRRLANGEAEPIARFHFEWITQR